MGHHCIGFHSNYTADSHSTGDSKFHYEYVPILKSYIFPKYMIDMIQSTLDKHSRAKRYGKGYVISSSKDARLCFSPLTSLSRWPATQTPGVTQLTPLFLVASDAEPLSWQQWLRELPQKQQTGAREALPSLWPNDSLRPKFKALTGREPQMLSSIRGQICWL